MYNQLVYKVMKNLTLLVVLAFALVLFSSAKKYDENYSYEQYQAQFQVKNPAEQRSWRKEIFKKNYEKFLKFQDEVGQQVELSPGIFMDWTQQQQKKFFSYRSPKLDQQQNQSNKKKVRSTQFIAPSSLDYRALGQVSPIKNQGKCGACWAFSTIASFQSSFLLQANTLYDLSEQFIASCIVASGCLGGDPRYAFFYLNSTGAGPQSQFPYGITPNCTASKANFVNLPNRATQIVFQQGYGENNIIDFIANYGPLVAAVCGSQSVFKLGSAQINTCSSACPTLDHVVLIVGYTPTHWIIKNSWGTSWGDKGFALVSRTNNCGLTRQVFTFKTNMSGTLYPSSNVSITVTMTDSKRNGWGGWVLGFRQAGTIVSNFTLASGSSGTVQQTLDPRTWTDIVVVSAGSGLTSQIGFKVTYTSTSGVIVTRNSGVSFSSASILATFCLSICNTTGLGASGMDGDINQGWTKPRLSKLDIGLIVGISIISFVFILTTTILCYKLKTSKQQNKRNKKQQMQNVDVMSAGSSIIASGIQLK